MKDKGGRDAVFILYMAAVVILAVIYFTVPERKAFLDYQIKWWSEFWSVLKSLF